MILQDRNRLFYKCFFKLICWQALNLCGLLHARPNIKVRAQFISKFPKTRFLKTVFFSTSNSRGLHLRKFRWWCIKIHLFERTHKSERYLHGLSSLRCWSRFVIVISYRRRTIKPLCRSVLSQLFALFYQILRKLARSSLILIIYFSKA